LDFVSTVIAEQESPANPKVSAR